MQKENIFSDAVIECDDIFFEDINEWDKFCNELDLIEVDNIVCLNKGE